MSYAFPDSYASVVSYKPNPLFPTSSHTLRFSECIITFIILCTYVCSFPFPDGSLLLFLPKFYSTYKSYLNTISPYTFQNPPKTNNLLFFHRVLFLFLLPHSTNCSHSNITFTIFIIFFYQHALVKSAWTPSCYSNKNVRSQCKMTLHFGSHKIFCGSWQLSREEEKAEGRERWRVSPWRLDSAPGTCHMSLLLTPQRSELVIQPCLTLRVSRVIPGGRKGKRPECGWALWVFTIYLY